MKNRRMVYLRRSLGLTQKQLAKQLYIARNTYSAYENGTIKIPLSILAKLALLYNVSIDYLLGLTQTPTPRREKKDSC